MNSHKKKVIIIGNSPSVLNYEYGSIIDSYDVVIRINRCVTAGFEKYIGSKTDIWSTSSWCLEMQPEKAFPNIKSETSKKELPYFFPSNIQDLDAIWYRTPKTLSDFKESFRDFWKQIKNKDNYEILWGQHKFRKNFEEFCNDADESYEMPNTNTQKKKKKKQPSNCKLTPLMKKSKADFDTGLLTILNSTLFFDDITIHGFTFYSESNGDVKCYYRDFELDSKGNHPEDIAWARAKAGNEYLTKFIDVNSTNERNEIIQKLVTRNSIKILNV